MNDTQIKTRHGMILQGALAEALSEAGYSFAQDYQYDETCEIPDFLIPDGSCPKILIETHQTDARDSFRMKTLRAFTAVTEAKAHYGNGLVSVNVLFGDPDHELPPSNVRAMCGFFDVNIIPRKDVAELGAIEALENFSLALASDEEKSTEKAISEVIDAETHGIEALAALLQTRLSAARSNRALYPLWKMERERAGRLGAPPVAGPATYYKRMMLRALFLTDEDFAELVSRRNPDDCSPSVQEQLIATGLADLEEAIDGDHLILDSRFEEFIKNPNSIKLRHLCSDVLNSIPAMGCFFDDIRFYNRRKSMVEHFLICLSQGNKSLIDNLVESLINTEAHGILHARCWMADLLAVAADVSQNEFNRRMVQTGRDPENYQYPFNHIAGRFERLLNNPSHFEIYADGAVHVFREILSEKGIGDKQIIESINVLENGLLKLRLDGAVKLQRFNPLYAIIQATAARLKVECETAKVKSVVHDLAGGRGRLGKYDTLLLKNSGRTVLCVSIAVHDNHGDDKSKEWGARRLASLYRMINGGVGLSEYQEAIFVLDGEWADKDVARLYRSGWNHVVRLDDLEQKLKEIFVIPVAEELIEIPEVELPLAAEEDDDGMEHHGG